MNFKEMQDRVKYTLGTEESTWNDELSLVKSFLNEGVVQILTRTRPTTRVINLLLTANTPVHDMAGDILALVDVKHPTYGFLRRYSRHDIASLQDQAGPGFAYEEPLLWISPVSTESLTIVAYGVFRPSSMTADTDNAALLTFGGLNAEFHPAVVTYALWKMGEYVQHDGSGEGEKWRIQYEGQDGTEGEIAKIKRILAKRVTPQASRRRSLEGNLDVLSPSGSYIGART